MSTTRRRTAGTALLAVATAALLVLLFVGGPGHESRRSWKELWETGHLVLFFLGTWLTLRLAPGLRRAAPVTCLLLLGGATVLGAATEWLQGLVGRSVQWGDLGFDLLGSAAALPFLMKTASRGDRVVLLRLRWIAALVLIACYLPAGTAVTDEVSASLQFPTLADFEQPLETGRWAGDAGFVRSSDHARSGTRSLRIDLGTRKYSGVKMLYFPQDWRGYRTLRLSLYNPLETPLALVLRIHDRSHPLRGNQYTDRFHRELHLDPGWNDHAIGLAEIRSAPVGRAMDLGAVGGLGLFAVSLPKPRTVYLDSLRLEN